VTEINADLLSAIEKAGRIVGQVQDSPTMTASERAYALSRACDALGGTYFKTTGRPLEWWRYEAAIDKATGQEGRYATASWESGDIKTLRPDWTDGRCQRFLEENQKYITEAMVVNGWVAIEDLLQDEVTA